LSRTLPLVALSGLLLAAAPALAQGPGPRGGDASPKKTAAAGEEPALAPGELRVRAESYEQAAKGRFEARGLVDMRLGGMRIQADKADVFEDEQPDGSVKRRLVAEGNVVFIRGEERLSGDRVEMDEDGRGFFENATGYVEPGVFIEGRRIERVDDDTYRVEGGKFTSCAQPNPRWGFTSSSARIDVDDKVVARNAVFKVKGIPVLYTPILYYPIGRDGRSTGFLFPHFGYSSYRGFTMGTGFFWAMGRSADQTFYADWYSKIGNGFGHELRYAQASPSRGTFRTYLFQVQGTDFTIDPETGETGPGQPGTTEYDIDWNALQMLPGKVRAAVNVRKYSDILFNQRYQDMNHAALRHNRDYVALFRDDSLRFEPGTSQRYSNGGFVLLGEVVAKASGADYYDYVRGHVFESAGMKGTDSFEADDPTPNVAMGYHHANDGRLLRENVYSRPARGSAAGGGYSTVDDILRFEQALRGGKLASPAWSRWVLGGPKPGPGAADGPMPDAYTLGGGALGITASIAHRGEWTLILLSNLDRGIMGSVENQLQAWLESVKE